MRKLRTERLRNLPKVTQLVSPRVKLNLGSWAPVACCWLQFESASTPIMVDFCVFGHLLGIPHCPWTQPVQTGLSQAQDLTLLSVGWWHHEGEGQLFFLLSGLPCLCCNRINFSPSGDHSPLSPCASCCQSLNANLQPQRLVQGWEGHGDQ